MKPYKTAILLLAVFLNVAQISIIADFLLSNTTDNLPFFVFLIVAPIVSLLALFVLKE